MATTIRSGNFLHDQACQQAYAAFQSAVLGLPMNASGQAALNAAEVVWARSCIASCKLNNAGAGQECFLSVLKSLGLNS